MRGSIGPGVPYGSVGDAVTHVFKAKKNKRLVRIAQTEWKQTQNFKRGRLWMRHVKGHSNHEWNDRADALAKAGCGGTVRFGAPQFD